MTLTPVASDDILVSIYGQYDMVYEDYKGKISSENLAMIGNFSSEGAHLSLKDISVTLQPASAYIVHTQVKRYGHWSDQTSVSTSVVMK